MKAKTALASVAMLSLALAQPAAAAATSSAAPVDRAGAFVSESESVGSGLWLIFAALGLTALMVVLLTDGDNAPASP